MVFTEKHTTTEQQQIEISYFVGERASLLVLPLPDPNLRTTDFRHFIAVFIVLSCCLLKNT